MISLAPNNDILVGGSDGYVTFSKDGGASFDKILDKVDSPGTPGKGVYVVADEGYADNGKIYAAVVDSSGNLEVERGGASATKTWAGRDPEDAEDLVSTTGDPFPDYYVTGMHQWKSIIYVTIADGSNTRLYRALHLATADTGHLAQWSWSGESGESLGPGPSAIAMAPDTKGGPSFQGVCESSRN
jgi:hypothetical protein